MGRSRIAALPIFAGLPQEEVDAVARAASLREFKEGEPLATEGDFGHCLFLVEAGSAEVSGAGGPIRSVGPGDVVGEIAVLASGRRTASVVATSPLTAFALFKRDVWALEHEAPEAARRLRAAIDEHVGAASPSPPTA